MTGREENSRESMFETRPSFPQSSVIFIFQTGACPCFLQASPRPLLPGHQRTQEVLSLEIPISSISVLYLELWRSTISIIENSICELGDLEDVTVWLGGE